MLVWSFKDVLLYLPSIKDVSLQVHTKDKNAVVKQIAYVELKDRTCSHTSTSSSITVSMPLKANAS